MNGAQVRVFEERDQIGFAGLLQCADSCRLKTQVSLEILSDFTNEPLKWEFANEQFGRFLIATNLTQSDGTWTEAMRLLDATRLQAWQRKEGRLREESEIHDVR